MGDSSDPSDVSIWVVVGSSGWVCAVGEESVRRNALFHLMCMQCIFFKFCFIVIKKDELCSLHSLVVRLMLSQAMFA